jgi:methylphosphotriester-DNA--protein-cysteine methyltransferase
MSKTKFLSDEARWAAVQQRDHEADGQFWYSVRTTGVYCRPSCGARPALRGNVAFHASTDDAEAAGFRACLRCKPDQPPLAERHAAMVAEMCRLIDAAEEEPDLSALAEASGMSRFHFHRIFKSVTGITPKAYAVAQRKARMQQGLAREASVTDAIYAAGFNSSGRFYAASAQALGMTPSAYRAGGSGSVIRFAIAECSLGPILVASTEVGICAILMGDDPEALPQPRRDGAPRLRPRRIPVLRLSAAGALAAARALYAPLAPSPTAGTRRWARERFPPHAEFLRAATRPASCGRRRCCCSTAGRLQLPAPGPVRRARVPAAGRRAAVASPARFRPAASSC